MTFIQTLLWTDRQSCIPEPCKADKFQRDWQYNGNKDSSAFNLVKAGDRLYAGESTPQ